MMSGPKGIVESLGAGSPESGEESDSGGSMLEQHLGAFKRALDGGNMKQAASCFKAAIDEASGEQEPDASDPGEDSESEY